ncbi:MAG: BspA family leucine-rich repeat surface protein [Blautia sp.]|nr:BspA family leucine-rich repeat surface protein [Blautia sp.]
MWFKRKKTGRRISGMLAIMLVFSVIPVSAVEESFSSVEVSYSEGLADSFETGEKFFPEVPSDSGNTGVLPDEDITNAFFSSVPDETQDGDSLSVNMPADEGDRPDEEEAWNTISYTDESESFGADLAALDEANYTAADEASKWNVSVYIPDLSPEENIRARILNQTGDEADGYLFSSFQQRIPENILYSVYAVELTSGYIENQNDIAMMIGGVDLVDYECIALFHFDENGETKEIPFSYDAAMNQVWFTTDGLQGGNTIYFGFAEKKEESVSNSSDPQIENTIVHDIDGFDSTDEPWNPPFMEECLLEETTETSVGIIPGDQPDAFDLEEEEGTQAATDDLADSVLGNQVEIPSYSETETAMETESETGAETQIEDGTEITTTAELRSTILRSPLRSPSADTTWQDDYRYNLDETNHHIDIEHYLGSAEIITVPAKAVINGIDYETHIVRSSAYTNGLFSFSSSLKEVYFENNVIADTMFHMFDHCELLEKVDFTGINASSSTDMSSLFERCTKLKSVIFPEGFDSSSVEYMFDMFSGCIALEEIDLKNLDTQSATYMSSMFYNCRSLKVIDVSGFHTTNVTTMSSMFKQCNSLESLDLSAFSTQNVTNMNNMIDCPALKHLDMSGFDYSQLSGSNNGFLGYAKKLRELKTGNGFGTNACLQVSDRDDTLWSDYGTGQYINSGDINGNNGSMIPPGDYRICSYYAFLYEDGDLVIQFSESPDSDKGAILASYSNIGETETTRRPWSDNSVVNQIQRVVFADPFTPRSIYAWFSGCQNLQEITGMGNIDVSRISSPYLDKAFENCTSLQCLDFSSFDTRNIASIEALIDGDHRLSTLILGRYFEFHDGVSLPGSSWIHQESGQVLTREFLEQNYDGTTMAGTYTSNSAVAILYEDGDLVFQNGTAPDPAKGSVLGIYFGFESAHYNSETPPWYGEKDAISKITFQTDVYPRYAHNLFSNLGNLTAISGIEHLHTEQCKCMANMFSGCSKLEMLDLSSMDTENVTEMEFMFSGCTALKAVDLSSFSTQNVTNMSYMFHECPALENLDLSSFDVRKVTAMDRMFLSCKALSGINLSSFHTESLVEMAGMFYGCESLQELDLSGFQTSLVSDMFGLFSSCTSLKTLDISSFDTITGNTAMENMFSQNNALQTIKLGERFRFNGSSNASWLPGLYWTRLSTGDEYESSELARVYDGSTMAGTYTNSSIKALLYENGELVLQKDMIPDPEKGNILKVYLTIETARTSPWRTEANTIQKVTIKHPFCPRSLYQFFCNCKNLTEIESIENMDTSNCTDFSYLFSGCSSLTNLDLSGFIVSPDAAAYAMLGTPSLEKIKLGELFRFNNASLDGTWKNVDTETVISGESLAASYDGSTMAGTYVRNDSYAILYKNGTMVFQRGRLSDPDLGEVDTIYSGFENTAYSSYSSVPWYRKADSIKNVIFKDTISPKGTSYWFYNCSELSEIENLDTLNFSEFLSAYGTAGMFYNCKKLKELDLRSFTISSLTNMQSMFCRCENLEIIDLSNLCTNTVKNMGQAFDGCTSLKILDLSSLGCRDVTNMNYAFRGCQSLLMLSLNADFVFKSSHSLPPMDWIRLDTQEEYTSEELAGLYNGIHEAATATYSRCTDIRFDASGGSTSFARKVCIYGTGIGELPSAARKGYFFDGWYTKRIGGIKIDEESIVDQSTYYAHWIPISYTLILNANGADPEDVTVNLDYSEPYTLPKDGYYREGYKLEGWNTRRNGKGYSYAAGDTIQKLSSEDGAVITLYAEWKELGYSILFDSLGGSAIPGRDIQAGHALGTLYSPAKDGFTFLGWFTQAEGGIQATAYTVPTEDTTYYAHWAKNPTLTFISNGDTPDYVKTVNYNSPIGQLPTASKENYTFIGWFTQNEGGEQVTPSTRAIHDTSYYAHWGLMLNFDPMGGRITEEAASDGMIAADPTAFLVESMPTVQKDGYTLDGWYSDPLNGNRVELGDSVDLTQGSTLYAHWVPAESVTLTYDPNGGSLPAGTVNPVEYYVGQEIFNLPVPTKYGCAFTGWFTDAEEGEPIAQGTVITEDLTLYAHWNNAPLVYLTFNANGGSSARYPYSYYGSNSYSVFSVRSGDTIQTLPGSNLSGYVLDGWFTEAEGGDKITEETPILYDGATGTTSSNPRMYYAHWKPVRESGSTSDISYTYSASWQNASNEQADNREGRLTFHPTYDTQQTAALNVSFELNSAVDTVLPEGSVKIRVPKKAFKNWDGEWTGGNNLSANLPEYPSRRNGMYFSYINEEGDFYVLVNNTELTGGAGVNVTISYTAMPRDVPGGGQTKDGTYAEGYDYYHNTLPITFSIDKDLNGTADAEEVKSLEIEMHTRVLSSQQKSHTATYYQWNNTWGKKPYDAEDYFYVQWKLYEYLNSYSSTQNCTYEWSEDTVHDGTVVYMTDTAVVTKHPVSLFEETGNQGVTLYNEALLTETWKSGYKETYRLPASVTVYNVLNHGSTTAKCAPVVYYSTRAKDSFTGSDWDVTNTEIWTSAKPTDSSSITAIAVDCSMDTEGNSFILNGKSAMTVYITMTAPGNAEYIGKKAYNQAVSFARKSSGGVLEGDATPEYSEASVALKDSDLALSKESSPVSGTQAAPATVEHEDDLNYILAVTNNDGVFTLHDIIFEDMIPEGLDVDWEGVKVYLDDPDYAIGIDLTPRAALTRNGRKAIFSIRELNPGETLRFLIPTVVTALEGTIENCAKITSVNGMEKNIASERTYHKIFDPTAADLTEDVTIEKKWISPKSAIAFDIRDSEGKTSKVSCIVITDNEGAIVETIQGANGAILSQKAYDVEKSYTATITFEDGSTKSAVINADPFEKPEIVIKVTTEDEEKSVVLGDDGGWTDTVTLNVGSHVFEEITTGDWSTSQEFDDAAKKAVFTNTITIEIPITVINTTSHSIVPQTGNPKDNSRAFALALFLASIAILAGYLISEKKRNKRS